MKQEYKEVVKEFIEYEKLRGIKKIQGIESHVKPFFKYIEEEGISLQEVGIKQAQEFQTWLSMLRDRGGRVHYATLTVISIIGMVKRLYNWLKVKGEVVANPFLRIKGKKTERRLPQDIPTEQVLDRILTRLEEFWKQKTLLKKKAYYRAHVMAELQYATGLRIQEVLELREENIEFERKEIKVKGKGGRERIVYLNEYASEVLKIYVKKMRKHVNKKSKSKCIFGMKGQGTAGKTYNKILKQEGRVEGLRRFTSHSFRHSLGYHLLRRGCDMRYIQLILGHENLNSTSIYTKVERSDLKSVLDRCHPRKIREVARDEASKRKAN